MSQLTEQQKTKIADLISELKCALFEDLEFQDEEQVQEGLERIKATIGHMDPCDYVYPQE